MSQFSRPNRQTPAPKSNIGSIVFLLGTVAAILILFPPWESKEERRDRVVNKVMEKVQQADTGEPRLIERKWDMGERSLHLKVVTRDISDTDKRLSELADEVRELIAGQDNGSEKSWWRELNQSAGKAPVKLDAQRFDLLSWCQNLSQATDGRFDITLHPYYALWNFRRDRTQIADPQVLESRVPLVGYDKLQLDAQKRTAFLPKAGMGIDTRMITAGLVLKHIRESLNQAGHEQWFVFFGSDSIAHGRAMDSDWKVALPHPRKALHHYGVVTPGDHAVMTANDYETGFVRRGFRYHIYLDPASGVPVQQTDTLAVLGPDPLTAEALAYALFVAGEKGLELIESMEGYEAVIMTRKAEVKLSSGMERFMKVEEARDY